MCISHNPTPPLGGRSVNFQLSLAYPRGPSPRVRGKQRDVCAWGNTLTDVLPIGAEGPSPRVRRKRLFKFLAKLAKLEKRSIGRGYATGCARVLGENSQSSPQRGPVGPRLCSPLANPKAVQRCPGPSTRAVSGPSDWPEGAIPILNACRAEAGRRLTTLAHAPDVCKTENQTRDTTHGRLRHTRIGSARVSKADGFSQQLFTDASAFPAVDGWLSAPLLPQQIQAFL